LYATQRHEVNQSTADGMESTDINFKKYFKLLRTPPVCHPCIFGCWLVQMKMQWVLFQKVW